MKLSPSLKSRIIFFLLFAIFSIAYYDSVLDKGPLNVHLWRQTDCLSLTQNYAEGQSFLEPEMHIQLADNNRSGKTVGEFPIMYYAIGKMWSWFGKSYLVYRLVNFLILFAGVFAFFEALRKLLKSEFWSVFLALLLFTSPALAYHGVSFMTDGPSFSFVLIALYFVVRYFYQESKWSFLIAILFFTLAGLIKVSSLIAFFVLIGVFVLELFGVRFLPEKRKIHRGWKLEVIGYLSVFVVHFAWYWYAHYYYEHHGFKYTFNNIWPIWIMDADHWVRWADGFKDFTSRIFFSRPMWFVLIGTSISLFLLRKRVSLFIRFAHFAVVCGCLCYVVLWGPLLENHDYYLVVLLIWFVGSLVPFVAYLNTRFKEQMNHRITHVLAILFLGFNFMYCAQVMRLKTVEEDRNKVYAFVGSQLLVQHMSGLNHYDIFRDTYRFERMQPYLEEIGVNREDKVLSFPDPSFNITLYMMDRKGWSNFNNYTETEQIQTLINEGGEYLIVSDTNYLNNEFIHPFINNQIGEFEGIRIYDLKE